MDATGQIYSLIEKVPRRLATSHYKYQEFTVIAEPFNFLNCRQSMYRLAR